MSLVRRFCEIIFLPLLVMGGIPPLSLDSVSSLEDSLSRSIAKIANEYFNRDLPTALFIPYRKYESHTYISTNDSHVDFLVQSLHQRIDHPLLMLDYHNNPQSLGHKVKLGSYIIILSGKVSSYIEMAFEVFETIYNVAGHMSPSGRLIIATTGSPKWKRPNLVGHFFNMIWRSLQISESIVLLPRIRSTDDDVIEIYKWFPEEQGDLCLLLLNRFVLFNIWILKLNEFILNATLFENRLITDMNNSELNAAIHNYAPLVLMDNRVMYGPLVYQFGIMCETLNIHIHFNPVDVRSISNFVLPVHVTYVKDEELLRNRECVITYPYFIQQLQWVVPAGTPVPRWKSLIKIFNPFMWFCVFTTFLIGSITSWLLVKQSHQSLTYISALLDTLQTYVVAGISDRFKGTVASTFFLLWLFYCLIINTAYQSALISFLADPGHDQPIKTIEELHKSGLNLMSRFKFKNPKTKELAEINTYEMCNKGKQCFIRVAQNRDTALLDEEQNTFFLLRQFYDLGTKKFLITNIEESVYTLYFAIAVYTHGCLLYKRMEQLIHRLFCAGLLTKFSNELGLIAKIQKQEVLNNAPFVITMSHLQGSFYFLMSGLFVSIIVFLIEVMYHSI
ncbi:Ionotropic receptor 485 [Blattella germanica]|nr:Ionotropic receptor 485 [Blattella germanica]